MDKYAQLGLAAQQGASNPIGLLNALIDAVEDYPGGPAVATSDDGLRAVAHQIISLYGSEFPHRASVPSICRALISATKEFGRNSQEAIGLAQHLARIFRVDQFCDDYGRIMGELSAKAKGQEE